MKIYHYLLILFACITTFSNAQDIDDLDHYYKQVYDSKEISTKSILGLRTIYSENMIDSLFSLGKHLSLKGIENDNKLYINLGKLCTGQFLYLNGKNELANSLFIEVLSYFKRKGDLERISDVQNQLGILNTYANQYDEAATWFLQSLETSEKLGKNHTSFAAQQNLSEVYFREEKYDLAESEIRSFIRKCEKFGFELAVKKGFDYLGKIYCARGEMKLGIQYYKKALEISLKYASKKSTAIAYNNIAIANYEMGDAQIALENFKKALDLRLQTKHEIDIAESYLNIGSWYYFENNFKEAIVYYQKSLDLCLKVNSQDGIRDALEGLTECYKSQGNLSAALDAQSKQLEAILTINKLNQKSSLKYLRAAFEIQREEAKYEQNKREKIIKSNLQNEKNRGKIIVIAFSIIIVLLLIFYFFLIAKNRTKETSSKKTSPLPTMKDDSKWNKLENFIESSTNQTIQQISFPTFTIQLIENSFTIKITDEKYFFWQSSVSKLENFVLYNYLVENILITSTEAEIVQLIEQQNLINFDKAVYGFLHYENEQLQIYGSKGIILESTKKITLLSENPYRITTHTMIISDELKNIIIASNEWDKLLKQLEMVENMSTEMALYSINNLWNTYLKNIQEGILFITKTH